MEGPFLHVSARGNVFAFQRGPMVLKRSFAGWLQMGSALSWWVFDWGVDGQGSYRLMKGFSADGSKPYRLIMVSGVDTKKSYRSIRVFLAGS